MLLHDRIGDGQPEARAFADLLRCKKRIEDTGLHILRHAWTVVVDFEHDGIPVGIVPHADDQRPAPVSAEHRLFGVDDQVEQDLLKLVGIENTSGRPDASASRMLMLLMRCS